MLTTPTPDQSTPDQSIENFLKKSTLSTPIKQIEPCAKSGNNRNYKITTTNATLALKQYFRQKADERDRLASEFAFLTYAKQVANNYVPTPFLQDPENGLALYEFIEGQPIKTVTENEIDQAITFFTKLNLPENKLKAIQLPNASEACFSIQQHIDLINSRLDTLEKIPVETTEDQQAVNLIKELKNKWQKICKNIHSKKINLDEMLNQNERCISPSDFGFHNALQLPDGTLRFLDFEYAGWDDPAKMIGDFFSQLAIPVPEHFFEKFTREVLKPFPNTEKLIDRAYLLRDVYRIKWCCIALNIFIPMHLARRKFANPDLDIAELKRLQLVKAENLMKKY